MLTDELNDILQRIRSFRRAEAKKVTADLFYGYGHCEPNKTLRELGKAIKILRDQSLLGDICICDEEIENIINLTQRELGHECKDVEKDFTREASPDDRWLINNPFCKAYDYVSDYLESVCARIGIDFKVVKQECASVDIDIKITDKAVCDAIDLALDIEEHKCDISLDVDVTLQNCLVEFQTKVVPYDCDIDFKTFVERYSCGVSIDTIISELNCGVGVGLEVGDAINCPASSSVSASPSASPSASVSPSPSPSSSPSLSPSPSSSVSPSVSPSASLSPSASASPSSSTSPSPSPVVNGNITGTVKDEFGNGIQGVAIRRYEDFDEDGVPDGALVGQVFTTSAGIWSMVNLVPNSYIVEIQTVANYTLVSGIDTTDDSDAVANSPTTDNRIPVTIDSGEIDADNNFIVTPDDGIISGTVLDDLGSPIENAVINIYDDDNLDGVADGALVTTGLTNASGAYSITGLQAGKYALGSDNKSYIIELEVPVGYTIVSGIDTSNDSDLLADADTTDNIIPCTLSPGETDANNNFIVQAI